MKRVNGNKKTNAAYASLAVLILAFVLSLFLVSCNGNGKDIDTGKTQEDITTTAENGETGNTGDSEEDTVERITLPHKKL